MRQAEPAVRVVDGSAAAYSPAMRIGAYLRNMGPASTRGIIAECARAADEAAIDDLWVVDHMAIPPDDSEGSDGRYVDPLALLGFLAAATERVNIGVGVLVVPYRPKLVTAKLVASIQELSGGRLLLGVGAGWMPAEFRALGVDREARGRITDETLAFLHDCFSRDVNEANGQQFLFRPRPVRPPIIVGGASRAARKRAVAFGDGWMPFDGDGEKLERSIADLRSMAERAAKPCPEVTVVTAVPLDDGARASDHVARLAEIGVAGIVHGWRYENAGEFRSALEALSGLAAAGE